MHRVVVSLLWLLHIILYLLVQPPASPFLNDMFVSLNESWGLLGTTFFGFFAFWLLWASVKGNVTINGKAMDLSSYCKGKKTSSTYMTVEFEETTWGYKTKLSRYCSKNDLFGGFGGFEGALYPGTYKLSVYLYKGYVTVQSAPGEGTTFELGLPRTGKAASRGETNEAAPTARPRRVLVVDDEDMVRLVTCRMLEVDGLEVDSLADGRALLDQLARDLPDVLLLDVTLPHKSGLELHTELRAVHTKLPVVLMSGHVDAHERLQLSEATATAFLAKPFSREQLMKTIHDLAGD